MRRFIFSCILIFFIAACASTPDELRRSTDPELRIRGYKQTTDQRKIFDAFNSEDDPKAKEVAFSLITEDWLLEWIAYGRSEYASRVYDKLPTESQKKCMHRIYRLIREGQVPAHEYHGHSGYCAASAYFKKFESLKVSIHVKGKAHPTHKKLLTRLRKALVGYGHQIVTGNDWGAEVRLRVWSRPCGNYVSEVFSGIPGLKGNKAQCMNIGIALLDKFGRIIFYKTFISTPPADVTSRVGQDFSSIVYSETAQQTFKFIDPALEEMESVMKLFSPCQETKAIPK